jgi:hypothetical protein
VSVYSTANHDTRASSSGGVANLPAIHVTDSAWTASYPESGARSERPRRARPQEKEEKEVQKTEQQGQERVGRR